MKFDFNTAMNTLVSGLAANQKQEQLRLAKQVQKAQLAKAQSPTMYNMGNQGLWQRPPGADAQPSMVPGTKAPKPPRKASEFQLKANDKGELYRVDLMSHLAEPVRDKDGNIFKGKSNRKYEEHNGVVFDVTDGDWKAVIIPAPASEITTVGGKQSRTKTTKTTLSGGGGGPYRIGKDVTIDQPEKVEEGMQGGLMTKKTTTGNETNFEVTGQAPLNASQESAMAKSLGGVVRLGPDGPVIDTAKVSDLPPDKLFNMAKTAMQAFGKIDSYTTDEQEQMDKEYWANVIIQLADIMELKGLSFDVSGVREFVGQNMSLEELLKSSGDVQLTE